MFYKKKIKYIYVWPNFDKLEKNLVFKTAYNIRTLRSQRK